MKFIVTKQAVKQAKMKSLQLYLKALKIVKGSLQGAILLFVFLQLMVLGLIGVIVTGVFITNLEDTTKLLILFFVFAAIFDCPSLRAHLRFFRQTLARGIRC